MRRSRLLVPTAVLGLVAPLAIAAVTSPAAAAGCGVPVWDFDHDGRSDAAAGAYPSGQVFYGDGTGGVDPGEVSLSRIREAVEGDGAESVEALAAISLADSVGEEDFCSLLAVGLPNATIDGQENAGAVLIFRILPGHDEYAGVEPDELLFTITQANDGPRPDGADGERSVRRVPRDARPVVSGRGCHAAGDRHSR